MRELPLRGAAQQREGGSSFWGSCRCDGGREEAVGRRCSGSVL